MSTTIKDLKDLMLGIGIEQTTVDSLDPDLPMAAQGLDSIDFPAFAVAVEQAFQTTISDDDSLRLRTLNDFVDFVNKA